MNLLNLFATLTLNKNDYDKGIKDAKNQSNDLKNTTNKNNSINAKSYLKVATAIIAVGTALAKIINGTIDYGDQIDKQSQKLNMSNEMYQKWALALQMAGADISSLSIGMRTFNNILENASNGQTDALLTLNKLGLGYEDFAGLSVEEIFYKVVEALQGMEAGTEKTSLAQELFGRAGQELLPLLNQEQGSLEELFKQFEDLGLIMDDTAVNKSAELNDSLFLVKEQFKALGREISKEAYPTIEELIDIFYKAKEYLQESQIGEKIGEIVEQIDELREKLKPLDELANSIRLEGLENALTTISYLLTFINDLLDFDMTKLGEDLGSAFNGLWSKMKTGFENFIDFLTKGLNFIIKGLNKISIEIPDWVPVFGGKKFGVDIPEVTNPLKESEPFASRFQSGKDFIPSDMYPAYLDYGERVLTRKENEKYSALGGVEGISALVNGMRGATYNNSNKNNQDIEVKVYIGDKEIKDYVYNIVNSAMKQKGLKSLNKVGGYND